MQRLQQFSWIFSTVLALLGLTEEAFGGAPRTVSIRVQETADACYFHVQFEAPKDLSLPRLAPTPTSEWQRRTLARLPQLVPQDFDNQGVYPRVELPELRPHVGFNASEAKPISITGLEFVGRVRCGTEPLAARARQFLLLYPKRAEPLPFTKRDGKKIRDDGWVEVQVEIDFSSAEKVQPEIRDVRKSGRIPTRNDLEGLWAEAQTARFAVLDALTPESSFYGFACAATARKYGVRDFLLEPEGAAKREDSLRRAYETTTGAAAITESLQRHRMLDTGARTRGSRTVDIWNVPGIEIAEHPWNTMMKGKKRDIEPLAGWVPHDNFYVHFKSVRKFIEFNELVDRWGTNVVRGYEMHSRDYDIKRRYEEQLCLRSGWLAKTLGPAIIRGVALTGSDGYLREGSDLAVIFQIAQPKLFLTAVDAFIQEARRKHGSQLQERKADYHGTPIEIFSTPLGEVRLHRAVVGDTVIYANSPTGLRRVLDARQGRLKALAEALDFQYMRTVFHADDKEEDGFLFLSDAFIRQLVGPASKIKAKRRLEALTSLQMTTNAALFHAWETGRLPSNYQRLLDGSALKKEEIFVPEGKPIQWDRIQDVAVSEVYNTLHRPTPLIELPIDKITPEEERHYLDFRQHYLSLWRQFFDPVGMRVRLTDRQVKVETFILPLIRDRNYDFLRQATGGGTALLDPMQFAPATILQGTLHLAPQMKGLIEVYALRAESKVGDRIVIRLDDTGALGKLAELWVRHDFDPRQRAEFDRNQDSLFGGLPAALGVKMQDPKKFAELLPGLLKEGKLSIFDTSNFKLFPPHRGVGIVRLGKNPPLFQAVIDDFWYLSTSKDALERIVDESIAARQRPRTGKKDGVPINASLYVSPAAVAKARPALDYYLEWETHKRALVNGPLWYALYRGNVISANDSEQTRQTAARRFLGFVPVSPDGATFAYDPRADEVVNARHGSLRRPTMHSGIAADSPLTRVLEEFRSVRADLRFREDGIHTTLTLERPPAPK